MQHRQTGWILGIAAGTAVASLAALFLFHGKSSRTEPTAMQAENSESAEITEQTDPSVTTDCDPAETDDGAPELHYPTVALNTAHYPMFPEAGLDMLLYDDPLRGEDDRYVMLRDSESVILSEPVSLMKMPEGSESVTLWLSYDPEQLGGLLSHTMIMRFDPDDGSGEQFYPVENTVTDEQQHRLSAEITEPGIYFAYDYDAWTRLWGIQTDSALCYRNPDIGFSVELPAEVMFYEYMLDCSRLDDYVGLPPEERFTDEYGADHIVPLMFNQSDSAEGVTGFTLEWIRECGGADTAAGHRIDGIEAMNQLGTVGKFEILEDQTGSSGGADYRIIAAKSDGNRSQGISGCIQLDAYYDLRDGEIVHISYSIDPSEKDSLYQPLRSSFDTFRKT